MGSLPVTNLPSYPNLLQNNPIKMFAMLTREIIGARKSMEDQFFSRFIGKKQVISDGCLVVEFYGCANRPYCLEMDSQEVLH